RKMIAEAWPCDLNWPTSASTLALAPIPEKWAHQYPIKLGRALELRLNADFADEINQCAQTRRDVPPTRIEKRDAGKLVRPIIEHAYQSAMREIRGDD